MIQGAWAPVEVTVPVAGLPATNPALDGPNAGCPTGSPSSRHSSMPGMLLPSDDHARIAFHSRAMASGSTLPNKDACSIAIVTADRRVRDSLADLVQLVPGLAVAGKAGTGVAAMDLLERARPDVVVIDLRLPDRGDGLALLRGLRAAWPRVRVLVIDGDPASGDAALAGGADRFLVLSDPVVLLDEMTALTRAR
jgi:CheY-like chemotaxis protein